MHVCQVKASGVTSADCALLELAIAQDPGKTTLQQVLEEILAETALLFRFTKPEDAAGLLLVLKEELLADDSTEILIWYAAGFGLKYIASELNGWLEGFAKNRGACQIRTHTIDYIVKLCLEHGWRKTQTVLVKEVA